MHAFSSTIITLALAAAAPPTTAQTVSAVASEFSAPTGSQANGPSDFETESSVGMIFYAGQSGRLDSAEFVLSDISGFVPEDARTDVEIRFYAWENGTLGPQLALIELPHEEIPDHVTQFTNWTWDEFDFVGRGFQIPIESGRTYAVLFSLAEPFTTPQFGRPNILGLARDREGPIYGGGEAFIRQSDGTTLVFGGFPGLPPLGEPGILDFFHRINVSRSDLPTDTNADGARDFFDALAFLERFDAADPSADPGADPSADYDLSATFDAADIRTFLAQLTAEASP
ncbi:MAG: hypothetical protein AAF235_03940 [Planctomycetota bacterium]